MQEIKGIKIDKTQVWQMKGICLFDLYGKFDNFITKDIKLHTSSFSVYSRTKLSSFPCSIISTMHVEKGLAVYEKVRDSSFIMNVLLKWLPIL